MPSPFPGMDPFLEGQAWKGFHSSFLIALRDVLVVRLRPRSIVEVEDSVYVVYGEEVLAARFPDVTLSRSPTSLESMTAGMSANEASATSVLLTLPAPLKFRQLHLVIRRAEEQDVTTIIELLSPWNKTGAGRDEYLTKRREILESRKNLVEIDLLRGGIRLPTKERLPAGDFFVTVFRRRQRPRVEVFPWTLREPMPSIPIPLSDGEDEAVVSLQQTFAALYDRAGYDYSLNRAADVIPSLDEEDREWVRQRLVSAESARERD